MKQLPKWLWKYFWDTDPALIDLEKYPQYVIERILEWGRPDDMRSRQLSIRNANFLATIWDVPKEEVLCLQPESRRLRKLSWNR